MSDRKISADSLKKVDKKPIRFVLVGVSNTVLDFLVLNILLFCKVNILFANTISTGIAMLYSFFMNKKWTFRNSGDNYVREVILFFIFTAIGIWVIQNGCIYLLNLIVPDFGLPEIIYNNAIKLAASIPSLTWNYLTYNRFVFTNNKKESATDDKEVTE